MNIETVPIDSVHQDAQNARLHNDRNLDAIAASLAKFGQQRPIVVDASGTIAAGNGTWQAAKRLGWETIQIVRTELVGNALTAYKIADNRTCDLSEFDNGVLADLLVALRADDAALPDAAGFLPGEIVELLASSSAGEKSVGNCDQDEVPATTESITKRGDIWCLGEHRLLCGDSTSADDIGRLMGANKAAMMFTDPPWNLAIGQDSNPRHRQRQGLENDNLPPQEFKEFLRGFLAVVGPYVSGDVYVVLGAAEWPTLDTALREQDYHWSATIIWAKDAFVLGRSKYHRRYEPIWYGWKAQGRSSFAGRRDLDDVWEIPRPRRSEEHPTMKPVELVRRAIVNSSAYGDIVLDPFGGSGTTIIAAEQSGRRARLIEISPYYCDVIVRRFEQFTGLKATRTC